MYSFYVTNGSQDSKTQVTHPSGDAWQYYLTMQKKGDRAFSDNYFYWTPNSKDHIKHSKDIDYEDDLFDVVWSSQDQAYHTLEHTGNKPSSW